MGEPENPNPRVDRWSTDYGEPDSGASLEAHWRMIKTHDDVEGGLAFYRRIFDEAPVAIVIATASFLVADANLAAQKLLRHEISVMRGHPFQSRVAKADRQAFEEISEQLIDKVGRVSRPLLMLAGDNIEKEVIINASAIRNENDDPEFIMLVMIERGENVSSDML